MVLFLAGALRPDLIGTGKTKQHNLQMFQRLKLELDSASAHVSLPNVLSEASNHLGSGKQVAVPHAAEALSAYISKVEEIFHPSEEVVARPEYPSVGLTDASIIACTPRLLEQRVRVFTQDYELHGRLCSFDVDCVNIMHWRTPER
ncbi:PIN domain-containing protein [Salibaculum griseiflavum]|uniref:hypothetical protein n=1 Tax=Salibaculum griseiflavum TaxID=1914409 RepID=UPI0011B221A2|nr:hypothetical protein [Salibaculum griseiflavum]